MKTLCLATKRGFCGGVENALAAVERVIVKNAGGKPVFVLHEIVHNEFVVSGLAARGVRFIEEPEEAAGGTLVFSAHGVSRAVEKRTEELGIETVDATCPIVKGLHLAAEAFERDGRRILFLGRRGHRETEGVAGRVSTPPTILENPSETAAFLASLGEEERKHAPFGCLSQTTLNADDVARMKSLLADALGNVRIGAEVCFATRDRQNAVKKLASTCGLVLVVGSEKSSNSQRLCETARAAGADAMLLPSPGTFDTGLLSPYEKVGITSGASAPETLVDFLICRILATGEFALADPES